MTTTIIKKVCDELGLKSKFIDDANVILKVDFENKTESNESHLFIANNSGLNDEAVRKICGDKFYTYLLLRDKINQPRTFSFIDPHADDIYEGYGNFDSNKEIIENILVNHEFPILVKANSLFRGLNVFKCNDYGRIATAVKNIFNKNSKNYDHVLISQDYIDSKKEYRVLVYNQEIMFIYLKNNVAGRTGGGTGVGTGGGHIGDATSNIRIAPKFVGNLSPLHWENSKAVLIKDQDLWNEIQEFIKPISSKLNLKYGGLDIIRDKNGELFLIEINTQPGFSYFVRDNTDEEVVKMYRKILGDLFKKC